ncbi:hypothetical protein Rhe02_86590 [Rhizocola hellebori]|uniref:Carrier domain-containing protein n=1 Tax=Rhizocola hellebori TaxID=1392758 RepID=A0A8J3QIE1_9ACTN|nr:acyl carrier protein [Rhizocola hellebori]GIH10592.1 hypothetical protein Rhe02_86590 [Rhizocola hellebori]
MDSQDAVTTVFREVLNLSTVDPEVGFLDLGGHSLLAVQVIALLRERYKLRVPTLQFLENASASAVAASSQPLEGN